PFSTVQEISAAAVASVAPSAGVMVTVAALTGSSGSSSPEPLMVPVSSEQAVRVTAATPAVRAPRLVMEERPIVMSPQYTLRARLIQGRSSNVISTDAEVDVVGVVRGRVPVPAVVGPPPRGGEPDLAVPDDVLHAQFVGVLGEPRGEVLAVVVVVAAR